MAETEGNKILTQRDESKESTGPFSLFPKLEIKLPFFNQVKKTDPVVKEEAKPAGNSEGGREIENPKPNIVRYPNTRPVIPSFNAEVEESSGTTHNPVIIWQVYALGGFFVLKWIWARWKERNERAKKASSDDNQSPDDQSPADIGE